MCRCSSGFRNLNCYEDFSDGVLTPSVWFAALHAHIEEKAKISGTLRPFSVAQNASLNRTVWLFTDTVYTLRLSYLPHKSWTAQIFCDVTVCLLQVVLCVSEDHRAYSGSKCQRRGLKMTALRTLWTSGSTDPPTQCIVPEIKNLQQHLCENLTVAWCTVNTLIGGGIQWRQIMAFIAARTI